MSRRSLEHSAALQRVLSLVSKVAPRMPVCCHRRNRTGKELIARLSTGSPSLLMCIRECQLRAMPRDLIASELFGHEKGSFTGAVQRRLGRFESRREARSSFDEVESFPSDADRSLGVLQEHEFERVGGTRSIQTNVR